MQLSLLWIMNNLAAYSQIWIVGFAVSICNKIILLSSRNEVQKIGLMLKKNISNTYLDNIKLVDKVLLIVASECDRDTSPGCY